MKYIVKNCENCFFRGDDGYFCEFNNENVMFVNPCENSTCLLKKVIEKCKEEFNFCDNCKGDPNIDCVDCTEGGKAIMADEILQMFEIEEVG